MKFCKLAFFAKIAIFCDKTKKTLLKNSEAANGVLFSWFCYYIHFYHHVSIYFFSQWYSNILWIKTVGTLFRPMFCILWQTEADTRGGQEKRVFLKILQSSQENTCAGLFFIKVASSASERDSVTSFFVWNLPSFLKHLLQNTWVRLLLNRIQM